MRVIVAGGGTGGHVFPALAIIEELRRRDPQLELWFVGKRGNIEERLARERGIPFRPIAVGALARRGGLRNLWSVVQVGAGMIQSVLLLLRFRPQVVIGTGGYVSVPPVAAGALLRVPTVIHEQNSVPGRANTLLARWVTVVAATFQQSVRAFGEAVVKVTGNPVRAELQPDAVARRRDADARDVFEFEANKLTVLVVGGSQGARTLTQATLDALDHLPADRVQVLLMTGEADAKRARHRAAEVPVVCRVEPFIRDMAAAYAAADVVVCRAGASTLAEVTAAGLPAILVPYPYAIDDHQRKNAEALAAQDAAIVVDDRELTGAALAGLIMELLTDAGRRSALAMASRQAARPAAAEAIADIVCDLAIPGKAAA